MYIEPSLLHHHSSSAHSYGDTLYLHRNALSYCGGSVHSYGDTLVVHSVVDYVNSHTSLVLTDYTNCVHGVG